MNILKPGEELIASEKNYRAVYIEPMSVDNAYDLYLVRVSSGNYILIVFMKLQFFFENNGKLKWTFFEKNSFISQWKDSIQTTWGGRTVKRLASGRTISVDFRFETQIEGWMRDHWELTVKRTRKWDAESSRTNAFLGNVYLESEDITLVPKGNGQKQRGSVHEFGHMLGIIVDEYREGGQHAKDYKSVMNRGEAIESRHDATYMRWLDKVVAEKGIN